MTNFLLSFKGFHKIFLLATVAAVLCISFIPSASNISNAPSKAQAQSWTLVWSDEFNGTANTAPSSSNWLYDTGTCYPGCPANNWGTSEVETMTTSTANVFQDGSGHLAIKPIRDGSGNWTSGRIETQRTDFQPPAGGVMRVEGSLQQPNVSGSAAAGYWPAFWMLGAPFRGVYNNWPKIGEIDLMEDINGRSSEFGTMHCGTTPGGPCNENNGIGSGEKPCSGCQTAFHTYAIEYDKSVSPEQIRWYLDGTNFFTVNANQVDSTTWSNATNHGFFIILNVAMGGSFPAAFGGGPTGSTQSGVPMLVDYVRVYTRGGSSPTATKAPATATPVPSGNGNPFNGTAAAIPGKVEVENYNTGGEGVAYHDSDTTNQGGQYRTGDGVDIETTTDTGGGYDVGYTVAGEWLKYSVNVTTSGTYNIDFRVASTSASSFHLEVDGTNVTGTMTLPNTGGWQTFTTVTKTGVNLSAGNHVLRLYEEASNGNYNWINFSTGSGATSTPVPATKTNTPGPTATKPPATATFVPPTATAGSGGTSGLNVLIDKGNGIDNTQETGFNWLVKNTGTSAISGISVRIYFTTDGSNAGSAYVLEKYYDQSGVATISGPTLATGSTYYFTISYGTASLPAGGQWEFQTALHLGSWASTFSGANDFFHTGYAVGALPAAYTNTSNIPGYVNGTLVWGTTP